MASTTDYLDVDPLLPPSQRFGLLSCVHDEKDRTRFALKLRGAFETKEEAGRFCDRLNKSIPQTEQTPTYVVDLGSWLCMPPPTPEEVTSSGGEEVFQEEFLQKMMKGYRENQQQKDEFFAARKNDLVSSASEDATTDATTTNDTSSAVADGDENDDRVLL